MEDKQRIKAKKACTFCKARKRKCDGLQPCSFCRGRGNSNNCSYDILDKRSIRYSHWKKHSHDNSTRVTRASQRDDELPVDGDFHNPASTGADSPTLNTDGSYVMDGLYNNQGQVGGGDTPDQTTTAASTSAASEHTHSHAALPSIPKRATQEALSPEETGSTRMLMDNSGNMRFIGESSPLSLLQQTRKIFSNVGLFHLAESKFVNDPKRFNIVDAPDTPNQMLSVPLPSRKRCDELVALFISNTNILIHVFEAKYLKKDIVERIYHDPTNAPFKRLCQLYIILAIGSLYSRTITRDNNDDHVKYFKSAMNIFNNSIHDGNLWLVECYLLISMFYQVSCKRNTSWINLGIAIRIAESVGLNRRKINESYADREWSIHRRKLWRSLYIMDRLTSIILGRPLSINNITWDDDRNSIPISTTQKQNLRDVCESQLVKLSDLNGEIYEKVYYNDKIDSNIAYDLAMRLKDWCMSLPAPLQAENLLKLNNLDNLDKEKLHMERYHHHPLLLLHLTHFNGVILLSRPFFHYFITKSLAETLASIKTGQELKSNEEAVPTSTPPLNTDTTIIKPFADSCVNAAVFTIKFSWFYIKNNIHPLKPYNMINNVFNSGLILALVVLLEILQSSQEGDQKKNSNRKYASHLESLGFGIQILKEFADVDSFAKRYNDILVDVEDALLNVIYETHGELDLETIKRTGRTEYEDGGESRDDSPTCGTGEVLDRLNDLDNWLFGSIFGIEQQDGANNNNDQESSSLGGSVTPVRTFNPSVEMSLLNAFMYDLNNNNNNGDILFDNTF